MAEVFLMQIAKDAYRTLMLLHGYIAHAEISVMNK